MKYFVKILVTTVRRLAGDTQGVTLVEYGIAIALAVGVGVAVLLPILASDISAAMGAAGAIMPD